MGPLKETSQPFPSPKQHHTAAMSIRKRGCQEINEKARKAWRVAHTVLGLWRPFLGFGKPFETIFVANPLRKVSSSSEQLRVWLKLFNRWANRRF